MTLDIEAISARVHDSWIETKRAMGFHGPDEPCPLTNLLHRDRFVPECKKQHDDMIPYEQLSEAKKELDRATVRTVLKAMSATTPSPVSTDVNFISEVRPDAPTPSCHVCGATTVASRWKCMSCGTSTEPSEVSS